MNPSEPERRNNLVQVCHYALNEQEKINRKDPSRTEKRDKLLGAVVSAAGSMKDISLFNQATALVRTKLPPDDLQSVSRWLWTGSFQLLREGYILCRPSISVLHTDLYV